MAGHRGAEAVAVFATVLALAACGTAVDDAPTPPSVAPTTEAGEGTGDGGTETSSGANLTGPTATSLTATSTDGVGAGGTSGPTATGATATGATATGPTVTGTAAEVPTTEATEALPEFAGPDELLQQEPTGAVDLVVEDVRLGVQDGYDRVVIDLSGAGQVGWWVDYADDPALDGSGTPVDLAGDSVLRVNVIGAGMPEPGETAYDPGLLLLDGGPLQVVTEVLRTSPFEGQVPVFIGTDREAPFRVFRLSGPERLVIDIQH